MSTKGGPYFLWDNSGKKYLCSNESWCTAKQAAKKAESLLCFETASAAKAHAHMFGTSSIQPVSSSTVKKRLGLSERAWHQAVAGMSLASNRAKEVPANLDNSDRNGPAEMVEQLSVASAPDKMGSPTRLPASETGQTTADLPNSIEAPYGFTEKTFKTPLIMDTLDIMERLNVLAVRWQSLKQEACDELKQIEAAILDELHFVEFMDLDMRRAYKSYKRLHELRIQRRRLKNECAIIDIVCSSLNTTPIALFSDTQHAIRAIDGMEHRKYDPRVTWPMEDDQVNF